MNVERGVIEVLHLPVGEEATLSHIVINNCEAFKWIFKDSFATIKLNYSIEVEVKINKCNIDDTREDYIVRGSIVYTRNTLWDDYKITTSKEFEITGESARLVYERFKDYYTRLSSKQGDQE